MARPTHQFPTEMIMTPRLTPDARATITAAEAQARQLRHQYVGTEHILLALINDPSGLACVALGTLGITANDVRLEVEKLVLRGPTELPSSELPLTPRSRRALEYAESEAHLVGQKEIGAEHLLLGLLREEQGVAGLVLRNLGMDLGA